MLDDWAISADAFNEDLSTWINVFGAAAEDEDTELMWRLLADAAERLLNVEEGWSRGGAAHAHQAKAEPWHTAQGRRDTGPAMPLAAG